jgi:release factor glutamine methyltransferase
VFAEEEAELLVASAAGTGSSDSLESLVARRVAGLPLEQLLGWVEFGGRRIVLEPGVFVPRRRSELLVREALTRVGPGQRDRTVVLDLCCGCGALGAVLASELSAELSTGLAGSVELHAVDIDPNCVRVARRNVEPLGGRVHLGDLYQPLAPGLAGRVDLLVAVTPYVPTEAIGLLPPEARDHEPRRALDGGTDGLDVLRRVVGPAGRWLAPGGFLLVETGQHQAPVAADAVAAAGLIPAVVSSDAPTATVVIGGKPGVPGGWCAR